MNYSKRDYNKAIKTKCLFDQLEMEIGTKVEIKVLNDNKFATFIGFIDGVDRYNSISITTIYNVSYTIPFFGTTLAILTIKAIVETPEKKASFYDITKYNTYNDINDLASMLFYYSTEMKYSSHFGKIVGDIRTNHFLEANNEQNNLFKDEELQFKVLNFKLENAQ